KTPPSGLPLRGDQATVLITGTTGALGSNLLAQLLASPDVSRVYALNRSHASQALPKRQAASLIDQGLDPALLCLQKLVLLEGDTTQRELGLRRPTFELLQRTVTHIILNGQHFLTIFTLTDLPKFEPAIKGARNLVDFALSSTAGVLPVVQFISSITVPRNAEPAPGVPALEEPILRAELVVGMGYGEAKWVVERMLQIATEQTGLPTLSVRVGLLGGGKSGCWDKDAWAPLVVRSAAALGCLPDASHVRPRPRPSPAAQLTPAQEVTWMSVPDAAAVLADLLGAEAGRPVLHAVHPRPTAWRTVFRPYAAALGVPLVPFSEWMRRLQQRDDAPASTLMGVWHVVTVRLLPFRRLFNNDCGLDDLARFEDIDMRKARALSPALDGMEPIRGDEVQGWFEYWARTGVLSAVGRARL
ncbi:NAD(P)-binding protein, partial [Auricularia subglabra TFB-10046 SS5]